MHPTDHAQPRTASDQTTMTPAPLHDADIGHVPTDTPGQSTQDHRFVSDWAM
jgi:hypothetical protein